MTVSPTARWTADGVLEAVDIPALKAGLLGSGGGTDQIPLLCVDHSALSPA